MSKTNLESWKQVIKTTNWDQISSTTEAQDKFDVFDKTYVTAYNKSFPIKKPPKRNKTNPKPWIDPWLAGACDRKNQAYHTYVKLPSAENKTKYQKLKKFTTRHTKRAKFQYYTDYFNKYASDGRKTWQMINSLLNRKKTKQKIDKLIVDGVTLTSNTDISSAFNRYFCNIATNLKSQMESMSHPQTSPVPQTTKTLNDMILTDCTAYEITEIIKHFKNKATSDTAVQALKFVNEEIAPLIADLINVSLSQGLFPSQLKLAKVIPLHKAGSKADVANYRPISLLPLISKVFEKVMHNRLYNHLTKYNIIHDTQFGFRAGHSCEHALFTAQNTILSTLNKKEVAVLLLIDFSKAFDMVDHSILLMKLEHYGVRSNALDWFRSYLSDRRQYVHVNNTDSSTEILHHGVPQGSILGPLLFIIYINDIPSISNFAKFVLYADDANIIVTGKDLREVEQKIEQLLPLLLDWITCNGLKLNIGKTKYLIFSNCKKHDINITIMGNKIERRTSERFLGVIMDENISWTAHRAAIATKISRNAGILFKLRGTIPLHILKNLFFSFIHSHLYFCPSIWGLGSQNSLSRIFSAQKKAIRAISPGYVNYFYNKETGEIPSHTKHTFNENGILTVHNLIFCQTMTTMSKIYRDIAPKVVCNMFVKSERNNHLHRSSRRAANLFETPRTRLVSEDHTIFHKGPLYFNSIAKEINAQIITENSKLKDKKHRKPLLQNKFTDNFKATLKNCILLKQNSGDNVNWTPENNVLQSLMSVGI